MNTKQLSEMFDIQHSHLVRTIKDMLDSGTCNELDCYQISYVSEQNKTLPCYDLSSDMVVRLITTKRTFQNSKRKREVMVRLLDEMKIKHRVVIGDATPHEDKFYGILTEFLGGEVTVLKQHYVNGYFVDFFVPEYGLYIEYDEDQHFSPANKKRDSERWESIVSHLQSLYEEKARPWLIRVKKGQEIKGLRLVANFMCLEVTHDLACAKVVNEDTKIMKTSDMK